MSKVITVARRFLNKHPKAGQSTFFVEKVLNGLMIDYRDFLSYSGALYQLNKEAVTSGKLTTGQIENSALFQILENMSPDLRYATINNCCEYFGYSLQKTKKPA